MGMMPNLLKGTEKVTTLGVTFRMVITSAGLAGISLDDILFSFLFLLVLVLDDENGFSET